MLKRPWLDALQPYGLVWPAADTVGALQNLWPVSGGPVSGRGVALQVVESGADQGAAAYEVGIAETGRLPTRNNAHDWFNALMWLAYPQTKRVLNHLQAAEAQKLDSALASEGRPLGNARTRLRDALTVLDENGAVFVTSSAAKASALQSFQWQDLFVRGRTDWASETRVFLLGHALLEKLDSPRVEVCSHTVVWLMLQEQWVWFAGLSFQHQRLEVDKWLASWISAHLATPRDLQPMPVLGVPGWWVANENEGFYNNPGVFRLGRGLKSRSQ
ncbi:MAG: DUF3025 domain-containing protein [Burkholderiales bacterium]|jgi:hypothetical protein|nr:DUF3025 domain-containing protein [Burkholderiales bacterium]